MVETNGYQSLSETLPPLRRDARLPVGDQPVLSEEPEHRRPWQQPYTRHQYAAFDPAVGEVLSDHVHGNLPLLDQVQNVAIHLRSLGLLPFADREARDALAGDRVVHCVAAQHYGVLRTRALHRGQQPKDGVILLFHYSPISRLHDVQRLLGHYFTSLSWDDKNVVRRLDEGVEVCRRAAPRARHELVDAALVDTHATVDPVQLATALFGSCEQGRDLILRGGAILLGHILAVDRVRVRRLPHERQTCGPLVGENADVVPAPGGYVEDAERRGQVLRLVGRIHERDGQCLLGHALSPSARGSCG